MSWRVALISAPSGRAIDLAIRLAKTVQAIMPKTAASNVYPRRPLQLRALVRVVRIDPDISACHSINMYWRYGLGCLLVDREYLRLTQLTQIAAFRLGERESFQCMPGSLLNSVRPGVSVIWMARMLGACAHGIDHTLQGIELISAHRCAGLRCKHSCLVFQAPLRARAQLIALFADEHHRENGQHHHFEQNQAAHQLTTNGAWSQYRHGEPFWLLGTMKPVSRPPVSARNSLERIPHWKFAVQFRLQVCRNLPPMEAAIFNKNLIRARARHDHSGKINSGHVAFQALGIAQREADPCLPV